MPITRPTFSESWYRVADLRIRLRGSTQVSRQFYRGERWYVVRDPAGNQFHRLSAPAWGFVGLLDGTRTVAEAWELVGGQMADDAPTQNEVIQILSQLHSANLIEANVTPDAAVLLRRHKKMQQRQWQGRLMNILFPRIPFWDPDQFLQRWMPAMRPLLGWFGAILWIAVVGGAVFSLLPQWARLREAGSHAIDPGNWLYLWIVFIAIKAIHELGHGFATRRFGGEVHEMGVMFLVLVPAPYVDASTAWGFPNKWARMFVGAGGMIFELFIAAIMAFVWLHTSQDQLISKLAFNAMFVASVSTILFNANPLLRYDGYYMLSDFLEIPNLRYRSTEYSMGLIKRHLFKVKQSQPLPTPLQRFWLLLYAITSSIYRTFIGIAIILMVWRTVPVLGVLMAISGVATWLFMPIFKVLKYLLIEPELHRKRFRATAWVVAFCAAVVVSIGLIRFKVHYEATAIGEPKEKQIVITRAGGNVDQVLVHDGQWVKAGQTLLVCRDEELELQIKQLKAKLSGLYAKLQESIVNDQNARLMVERQIHAVKVELGKMEERFGRLTVVAPIDGEVVGPHLKDMKGMYVKEGTEVVMIAQPQNLRITVSIDQTDAALPYLEGHLNKDTQAEVRFSGELGGTRTMYFSDLPTATVETSEDGKTLRQPTPTFTLVHPSLGHAGGGEAEIDPTDPKGLKLMRPHVNVFLVMPNPSGRFVPGQRAYVRFSLDKKPLIWNWARRVWQIIQANSASKWT